MFSALTVVALVSSSFMMVQAQCPCQEIGGPYSVVCSDHSLTSIPDCVLSNITRLSIETPSIPLVHDTISRFTNLERLEVGRFSNPRLSKTFLSSQINLSTLGIFNTSLDYVDNDWFRYAPRITTLFLEYNKIPSLAEDTFRFLPLLHSVELYNNQLISLPPTLFEGTALKNLYLHGNPWHCDCELATFMQWTRDHGVALLTDAYCLHPVELEGLNLRDLTPSLACTN